MDVCTRKTSALLIILSLIIVVLSCLPACNSDEEEPEKDTGLILNDYASWGDQLLWASLSVKNTSGEWITGLDLEDFTLSEELISPDGDVVDTKEVTFDEPDYQFDGDGFWERTVTSQKIDIVFTIDSTSSMSDAMPGIRSQTHDFVSRLLDQHTDFRIAFIIYGSTISDWFIMPFKGVMEAEEIHEWIDMSFNTRGESHNPTFGYDALMYATQLGFRDDTSSRIIVAIADTVPASVFGTNWYVLDTTAACYPAAKAVIDHYDVKLYYSQPDDMELEHLEYYVKPNPQYKVEFQQKVDAGLFKPYQFEVINPRAMDGYAGMGTPITWPFDQEDITLPRGVIADSQYYFAWVSDLELPDEPEHYQVRVTAKVNNPDKPSELLEKTFEYVPYLETSDLEITVTDEIGRPTDDVWIYLMREMGDRHAYDNPYWQMTPDGGKLTIEYIPTGKYYLYAETSGSTDYHYYDLSHIKQQHINIEPDGLSMSLQMETCDKFIETGKVRGLLKELDNWRSPGDPFNEFAQDVEQWLISIENNGISWEEMTAIKRMYIGLSGYANMNQFAENQTEGAIDNFYQIMQDIRDIIEQVKAYKAATEESFEETVAAALLEGLMDLITYGEFTSMKTLVEEGLKAMIDYAENDLLNNLVTEVINQIPAGPYKPLIAMMVSTLMDAEFDDWEEVINVASDILLTEVLEEACETIGGSIIEGIFDEITPDTEIGDILKGPISDAIISLLDDGFYDFGDSVQQFARSAGNYVLEEGREVVVDAVTDVLNKAHALLPAGDLRDFIIGITGDLLVAAIPVREQWILPHGGNGETEPEESGWRLDYRIDSDLVVKSLVRHGLYHVVLKKYYVDEACSGMNTMLLNAENYSPEGYNREEWEYALESDFEEYWRQVEPLQDIAWNALSIQEDIEDWAEVLEGLVFILRNLSDAIDAFAIFYPPFRDEAQAVHGLIAVLDGLQVIPRAIEFGLMIDGLDTFGKEAETLHIPVFP